MLDVSDQRIVSRPLQPTAGAGILAIGAGLSALGIALLVLVLPGYAASLGASGIQIGLLLAGLGLARLLVASPALTAPAAFRWLLDLIGPLTEDGLRKQLLQIGVERDARR